MQAMVSAVREISCGFFVFSQIRRQRKGVHLRI